MIDLRSDTVTRPTPGMLKAMTKAETGDDVFGEDPTVNNLEQKMAELFGMEAGLFVPSGTMGNQLCLKVLTNPGDEVIIDETGHIYNYETAAAAQLSSIQLRPVTGIRGKLTAPLVENAIRPGNDWDPHSKIVALENSTNKGGGACYTKRELASIRKSADDKGLRVHLDGARIWNAMTATDIEPRFFGTVADTLSICFSKGLGAPVGSMMLATEQDIQLARRYRKMWGGGMRQAGVLAAAADYAVQYHLELLADDHRRAKELATELSVLQGIKIDPESVESNIVLFTAEGTRITLILEKFRKHDVLMVPFGSQSIRATFHFGVDDEDLADVVRVCKTIF